MSQQARIDSLSVLSRFRASLATFGSIAATALDEAGTDIQRTLQWLREDRHRYWKLQVQMRTQQYTQAKLNLNQREVLDRAVAGTRSSCVEERRALQIAERRLREAEHTFRLVRVYSNQIEKEAQDYKGAIHGLVNALEAEIPNACARLERMAESLERYIALAPPEMPGAPSEDFKSSVVQSGEMPPIGDDEAKNPDESEDASERGRGIE